MTGNAGTPRYMAPEVAKNEKYGYPSDVYSFSILLWEIMTLDKPFDYIKTLPQFNEEVVRRHDRPSLKKVSSPELKSLLEQCWDKDQENRADFPEVCRVLRKYLSDSEPKRSKLLRHRSTLESQMSSVESTAATKGSGHNRQDSGNDTQVTISNLSSLQSSRRTNASDPETERRSPRALSFFPWRREALQGQESPSYRERTWVQRALLRKPTMSLDISSKAYRTRKRDLGGSGSFRSNASVYSDEEVAPAAGRRQSHSSQGSDRPQRRRSSGANSTSHIEAMAAALAAEAKSNKQFLREMSKRGGSKKKA